MAETLDWNGLCVVVVGLGASGVSASRLARRLGASVVATDTKLAAELSPDARALSDKGIRLALGGHHGVDFDGADLIVVSPGVAPLDAVERAARRGVAVWGEVELSVRAALRAAEQSGRPAPAVLSVGGTNGKSTTTALLGALFEAAGFRTFTGGNLGEPLSPHVEEPFDVIVLEVSSFQLERVDRFCPTVSLLLNVTPDHLDRYPDFEAYASAKGNAFQRQTHRDVAVIPFGDPVCLDQAQRGQAARVTFGGPGADVQVTHDAVCVCKTGERYVRADFALSGGHNALNVAAALAALEPFAIAPAVIRKVLREFRGLAHRTAWVADLDGVRYYDDSKGTNVGASVTALLGILEPKAVLIAGGRDKGGTYTPLVEALVYRGRAVVVLGEAADRIAQAVGQAVPVHRASSMEDAVRLARTLAREGDAVLLSPACSSFDMFRDYKDRGDAFVRAVTAQQEERQ